MGDSTFMIHYTYTHVYACARYLPVCASTSARMHTHCVAQDVATPIIIPNFHDQKSNHEIHETIVPQKFGSIQYSQLSI